MSFNLDEKPGVSGTQKVASQVGTPMQYADGVIHLNLNLEDKVEPMDESKVDEHIVGLIMSHQYSLKKGLELFGNKAKEAAMKELKQIHDMDTYTPIDHKTCPRKRRTRPYWHYSFSPKSVMGESRVESVQ